MLLPHTPAPVAAVRWPRRIAAAIAGAAAALVAGAMIIPGLRLDALASLLAAPATLLSFGQLLATGAAVGLVVLSRGLGRGMRGAADAGAALLAVVALAGIARGAPEAAIAGGLGASALLATRARSFAGRAGGRWPVYTGLAIVGVAAAAAFAIALDASGVATGSADAGAHAAGWLLDGGWWLTSGSPASVALDVAAVTVLTAGTFTLGAALRPRPAPVGHNEIDHERAAAIVAEHAADSLDPFALREDKAFHFAHGGLLAYRTVGRTAVVAGDPIGPPGRAAAILAHFEETAARRGWDVVLTAASERHLEGFRALGYRTLQIGEEAVVDPARFTLDGRARKTLRKAVGRVARHGWTIEVIEAETLGDVTLAEIESVERAWRARQARIHGFAMNLGRLWGAREDNAALYVLGRGPDGRLLAFLRFARYPAGLSLDAMRRLADEPNGVTEALIVAALEHARSSGMREVSLNFAGFAHLVAPREDLALMGRIGRRALGIVHGRFQLDRLARFNERFGPQWRPRHLVWRGALGLPRLALRVLQAEAYIEAPTAPPVTARWRPQLRPIAMPQGSSAATAPPSRPGASLPRARA